MPGKRPPKNLIKCQWCEYTVPLWETTRLKNGRLQKRYGPNRLIEHVADRHPEERERMGRALIAEFAPADLADAPGDLYMPLTGGAETNTPDALQDQLVPVDPGDVERRKEVLSLLETEKLVAERMAKPTRALLMARLNAREGDTRAIQAAHDARTRMGRMGK